MSTSAYDPPQGPFEAGWSASEVEQHLEEVLESPMFHTSQRSCQFLRYVVEAILSGHPDLLKERTVGERVFGRQPDYDTGQDSIVRVKASEVRRRLAQYYNQHPEATIRIELPPGAYTPIFHRRRAASAERQPAAPEDILAEPRSHRARWLAVLAAIALMAGSLAAWRMHPFSAFSAFWAPFLSDAHDPILCVPSPEAYRIYGSGKPALIEALKPRAPGLPMPAFPLGEAENVRIVPEPGKFVGIGDARALTLLYSLAVSHGKNPQVRQDPSFTELRAGPDLLIGAFSNHWSMDLVKDARYEFGSEGTRMGIRDQSTGKWICRKPSSWEPRGNEDCAVVTRILHSKTGNPLLVAAGLDHYGTFGVGEFLTRHELLEPVLRTLPQGWQERNLQIVLRVEVVRDNVGPPQVLATHVW